MSNLTSRYFNTFQNLISLLCRTHFVCSALSLEPVPPICVMSGTGPPQSKHHNDLEHPVMMGMRIDIIKIRLIVRRRILCMISKTMVMMEEWNKIAAKQASQPYGGEHPVMGRKPLFLDTWKKHCILKDWINKGQKANCSCFNFTKKKGP